MKKTVAVLLILTGIAALTGCADVQPSLLDVTLTPMTETTDIPDAGTDNPDKTQAPTAAEPHADETDLGGEAAAEADISAESTIEGTVVKLDETDIEISLSNGSAVAFRRDTADASSIGINDRISLTYTGDIETNAAAVAVTLLEKAERVEIRVTGKVVSHDADVVFVQTDPDTVCGFRMTPSTEIGGADSSIRNNAEVEVTFTDDLNDTPTATAICILVAGEADDPLVDKQLSGHVIELIEDRMTVELSNGKQYTFVCTQYTFVCTQETCYQGVRELIEGCRVRVTYDGYASQEPDAKRIEILEAPEAAPVPTATPEPEPTVYKVTGYITDKAGNSLAVAEDNTGTELAFLIGAPEFIGDDPNEIGVGDRASVTYIVEDGEPIPVKINYIRMPVPADDTDE